VSRKYADLYVPLWLPVLAIGAATLSIQRRKRIMPWDQPLYRVARCILLCSIGAIPLAVFASRMIENRDVVCALCTLLCGFALFMPDLIRWPKRKLRYPEGHCQACGYNLTGNVSGRCSECGTAIPEDLSLDASASGVQGRKPLP
jgi:hypothetical protein